MSDLFLLSERQMAWISPFFRCRTVCRVSMTDGWWAGSSI